MRLQEMSFELQMPKKPQQIHRHLRLTFKVYCTWQSFNAQIIIDIKFEKPCAFLIQN